MKIPTTQRTVSSQETQVSTPQVSGYNIPNAVPGQFGQDKFAAQGRMGEAATQAGLDISTMIKKQQQKKMLMTIAQKENQLMLGMQDVDFGEGDITKTDSSGKEITVPKGIKNRMGYQAQDSTKDWQDSAMKLSTDLTKDLPKEYQTIAQQKFLSHIISKRDDQIKFETDQIRKADKDTFKARNETLIDSTGYDEKSLMQTIAGLNAYHSEEAQRFGQSDEERTLEIHKDVEKAVGNATTGLLNSTGDLKQAQELLDKSKEYLLPKSYEDIKKDLQSGYEKIDTLKKFESKMNDTQNAFDLSNMLVNGTLTTKAVRDLQRSGSINSETAAIYDIAARKKYGEMPTPNETGKSDYFINLIKDNIDNKKELTSILKDATSAYGTGKLGADQYAYIIGQAGQRFDKERKKGAFGQESVQVNDTTHYAAVKGLSDFSNNIGAKDRDVLTTELLNNFIERTKKGEAPDVARGNAIKDMAVKLNPKIVNNPKEGKIMTDRYGNQAIVFPDGTFKEIKSGGKTKEEK